LLPLPKNTTPTVGPMDLKLQPVCLACHVLSHVTNTFSCEVVPLVVGMFIILVCMWYFVVLCQYTLEHASTQLDRSV